MPPSPTRAPAGPVHDTIIDGGAAVIAGAGLAGLFAALKLAPLPVTLVTASPLGTGAASGWAQGGIAAVVAPGDTVEAHVADTITAGAGLVEPEAAMIVARETPARIADLEAFGVRFDRTADGAYALGREGGHHANRIVHVSGDRAGAAVLAALIAAVRATPSIRVIENVSVVELAIAHGAAAGLIVRNAAGGVALVQAANTVLALGGVGALYAVTTNPASARGQGLGLAARAGAVIADAEFVQFHPTALAAGRDPAPLVTEALRGEGAILLDARGRRFMPAVHPDAELAPRDVVARALARAIQETGRAFIDARAAIGSAFPQRFPTVFAAARAAGLDPVREPLPVAPAVHYHMGGIRTDLAGQSSIPRLHAIGECAATGVHGANRLASNSLAEALVFAARAAEVIAGAATPCPVSARPLAPPPPLPAPAVPDRLRRTMTERVGLLRDGPGLAAALAEITALRRAAGADADAQNMLAAALMIAAAAHQRCESRGAHLRTDYPFPADPPQRSALTLAMAETIAAEASAQTALALP